MRWRRLRRDHRAAPFAREPASAAAGLNLSPPVTHGQNSFSIVFCAMSCTWLCCKLAASIRWKSLGAVGNALLWVESLNDRPWIMESRRERLRLSSRSNAGTGTASRDRFTRRKTGGGGRADKGGWCGGSMMKERGVRCRWI
jgi:hypothetical protein